MTGPLWQASAIEVAAGIREKQFSCSEVMRSVVERIRALNPKLNAIILDLTDQALAEAAAADRALKDLAAPGPLFGVPVTIKVNIDVEGQATTNGVPAFRSSPRRAGSLHSILRPPSSAGFLPSSRRYKGRLPVPCKMCVSQRA